jgi:hypothetical protein
VNGLERSETLLQVDLVGEGREKGRDLKESADSEMVEIKGIDVPKLRECLCSQLIASYS